MKLKQIKNNEPLSAAGLIKKELIDSLNRTIDQSNNEYLVHINQLKNHIDHWIEENLKLLREILSQRDGAG